MPGADAVVAKVSGHALDRGVAVRTPVVRARGVAALAHCAGPTVALGRGVVGDGNMPTGAFDAGTHGLRRGRRRRRQRLLANIWKTQKKNVGCQCGGGGGLVGG